MNLASAACVTALFCSGLASFALDLKAKPPEETGRDRALALDRLWESQEAGFTERVECSPTEAFFAALATDGAVRICDFRGKTLQELRHPTERMAAAAYSPDGTRLLAGTRDGRLLVWELKTGDFTEVGQRSYAIDRVAWLGKTGRALVCSARKEQSRSPETDELHNVQGDLFEVGNGKAIWSFTAWQHLDYQNLATDPRGEWVAVFKILKHRGIYLLEGQTGKIAGDLLIDAGQGLSVAVSPDGEMLAIGNPGVYLWDVKRRQMVRHLEGHSNWVVALAYSPDGTRLVSGAGDSTARVWEVKRGREAGRLRFPGASTYVHSVSFSFDGKHVLAAAEGGHLILANSEKSRN